MVQIRQSNPNHFKEFDLRLKQLQGFQGKVGWFESAKYPDGTPVAYVAAIQEYGHGPIPPRLGMRALQAKKQDEWKALAGQLANRIVDGKMTGKDAMESIVLQGESDLADHIAHVTQPPLSPITLAARKMREDGKKVTGATIGHIAAQLAAGRKVPLSGNTKPLNDTGYLIATLSSIVETAP